MYTALTRCRSRLIVVEQETKQGVARAAIQYLLRADPARGDMLAEKYTAPPSTEKRELAPDEWRARGALQARLAPNAE